MLRPCRCRRDDRSLTTRATRDARDARRSHLSPPRAGSDPVLIDHGTRRRTTFRAGTGTWPSCCSSTCSATRRTSARWSVSSSSRAPTFQKSGSAISRSCCCSTRRPKCSRSSPTRSRTTSSTKTRCAPRGVMRADRTGRPTQRALAPRRTAVRPTGKRQPARGARVGTTSVNTVLGVWRSLTRSGCARLSPWCVAPCRCRSVARRRCVVGTRGTRQFIAGLSLTAVGNLATADMGRILAPDVDKHLKSSNAYLRKKARSRKPNHRAKRANQQQPSANHRLLPFLAARGACTARGRPPPRRRESVSDTTAVAARSCARPSRPFRSQRGGWGGLRASRTARDCRRRWWMGGGWGGGWCARVVGWCARRRASRWCASSSGCPSSSRYVNA